VTRIMSNEKTAYGKLSYEYSIGAIKSSAFQPLSAEQLARLRDADYATAVKLMSEYGYPPVGGGVSVTDSIEKELSDTVAFVRANAPDPELTDALLFEEDALNLKIYLKAYRSGTNTDSFYMTEGAFPKELLRICAETDDFSLLGEDIASSLEGIDKIDDPSVISCMIDSAMFAHSLSVARKKKSNALIGLLEEYAIGRNRLTALRLKKLGRKITDYPFAFLSSNDVKDYYEKDEGKKESDIIADTSKALEAAIDGLEYDEGMGYVARFCFLKKNEAAALRLMFAEKSLTSQNDADGGVKNG